MKNMNIENVCSDKQQNNGRSIKIPIISAIGLALAAAVILLAATVFSDMPCFKKGLTENAVLTPWEHSDYFSDDDMKSAFEAVKDYFAENNRNWELLSVTYSGDDNYDCRGGEYLVFNSEIQVYYRSGGAIRKENGTAKYYNFYAKKNTQNNSWDVSCGAG